MRASSARSSRSTCESFSVWGRWKVVVMKRIKREMMMKLMKRIHVGEG